MFGYENAVDRDFEAYCSPDICPFCDQQIEGPEHKPEDCEAMLQEEDDEVR